LDDSSEFAAGRGFVVADHAADGGRTVSHPPIPS
jgi:hypothetical protein